MVKIEKMVASPPISLIPAFKDLFPISGSVPISSARTNKLRMALIAKMAYIDSPEYNKRYKRQDVKDALVNIYKNKCAFCEKIIEQYHVEHYRPKKTYYWLAFSWDNLLLACATCNQFKGANFAILGKAIAFTNSEHNIRRINNISRLYDRIERPILVNPEVTDPLGKIEFQKDGQITSNDDRFIYTIEKCRLDRKYLNDARRKLLDVFRRDIISILVEYEDPIEQQKAISFAVKKFFVDAHDDESPFLGFRRFAIQNGWLKEISKRLN